MGQQVGCLALMLALVVGIGAFFVVAPGTGSVGATPAPMLVATPAPSTPGS